MPKFGTLLLPSDCDTVQEASTVVVQLEYNCTSSSSDVATTLSVELESFDSQRIYSARFKIDVIFAISSVKSLTVASITVHLSYEQLSAVLLFCMFFTTPVRLSICKCNSDTSICKLLYCSIRFRISERLLLCEQLHVRDSGIDPLQLPELNSASVRARICVRLRARELVATRMQMHVRNSSMHTSPCEYRTNDVALTFSVALSRSAR